MNETIRKFGHPATLIREYQHWVVLLRPQQPTAGSLVLAAKSDATAFSDLDPAAFAELAQVTSDIEATLRTAVSYERINYLMLMMVDPHVHFHVIPRYDGERTLGGVTVPDQGWPRVPDLGSAVALEPGQIEDLVTLVKGAWPQS
jgi:diadenosine tetraphosphate (Ap4A) HIT family hydrolase